MFDKETRSQRDKHSTKDTHGNPDPSQTRPQESHRGRKYKLFSVIHKKKDGSEMSSPANQMVTYSTQIKSLHIDYSRLRVKLECVSKAHS